MPDSLAICLELPICVAVIEAVDLRVTDARNAYEQLQKCAADYHMSYAAAGSDSPGDVPGAQVARRLFRSLGVDPTKTRPSSEALLRRALKSKPLFAINTLVDVGNWCSLEFLLPLGLYDRDKIFGPVVIRQGLADEQYQGIGDRTIHVAERYVLADDRGAFGSPVADSLRTAVSTATSACAMILLAPADYDTTALQKQAETAAERITAACGGRITRTEILTQRT